MSVRRSEEGVLLQDLSSGRGVWKGTEGIETYEACKTWKQCRKGQDRVD